MTAPEDVRSPAGPRIGCAGWAIPAADAASFPGEGSRLERYARTLTAVEINSTFYRPHRPATYERWAAGVPESFRFSVKAPKEISHARRLADAESLLARFLDEIRGLGGKLGPILVQLPPSLGFEPARVRAFFEAVRARHGGEVACEPRHASWSAPEAEGLLRELRVARVAADPSPVPQAGQPGGWDGLAYFRLHGSPQVYRSPYPESALRALADSLLDRAARGPAWCIFDNTAAGAATGNALTLLALCRARP